MPDTVTAHDRIPLAHHWPPGLTRVPFWLYQDPEVLSAEQKQLFEGPFWNYLALEVDIPNEGDYRTTFIGQMPVIVVRGAQQKLHAFENRCAHRGALIAFGDSGNVKDFTCAYHAWRYDLAGNLCSIAFQRGVNGKGGMPKDFRIESHGPRKLRVTTIGGLIFGTLSPDTPDIETYLGPAIVAKLRRVLSRKIEVIGRFIQPMPNNWKLYAENLRDSYHASLLHTFFTTFHISRFSQAGGITVSEDGAHHASATVARMEGGDGAYKEQNLRADNEELQLRDMSFLDSVDEIGDSIQQQLLTVFPTAVLQQTRNVLAVRHYLPRGVDQTDLHWIYLGYADDTPEMRKRRLKQTNLIGPAGFISLEDGCIGGFVQRGAAAAADEVSIVEMGGRTVESQDTRVTETAIRGFWQVYRAHMGV